MLATQADSLSPVPLHEVITFYSYKGGTGRTMALANIACLFARQGTAGLRVLAIDWDLEAPGLHYYLRSPNGKGVDLNSAGVVEHFSRALELVEGTTHGDDDADVYAERILAQIPFKDYCHATGVTNLDVMPAGRLDPTYQRRLTKIDWQRLYEKTPAIFRSFARQVARDYDVVLVDSRTGMTDISGICTALLPDKLVVVFTPNQQSLAGVEQLVLNSVQYRQGSGDIRPLMVYPLPSRIDAERDKLRQLWRHGDRDPGVEGFQPQFERIFCAAYALESCDLSSYFDEVQIQYSPDYSYGEEVATWDASDADRFSIVRSYQALVQWLQSSAEPWESPESAALKKRLDLLLRQEADVLREDPPTDVRGLIGLQEEVFRLASSQRGPHHSDTVSAAERLIWACLHQATDLPRAMELFDQLARGFSQMRSPVRSKALGIILNGASVLRSEGRTQDADRLVQSITTFARENSSELNESTVDLIEHLADNLCEKQAVVEAHALLDFIVQQRSQLLGPEHPETLRSMDKVAEMLWAQHDLGGALRLQEQMLEVRRRVLGEEHADTLTSMNNLAYTLSAQGDLGGARRLQEQVLEVRRRVLGEEHPDTLTSMNNLAYTLSAQGDLGGARRLLERVLEIRGEENSDTLTLMSNLAYSLSVQGDLAGARRLQEQVLEARRRMLGEEHPDTLRTMNNLAETLHAQRDLGGARRLQEQVLEVRRRVLGEEHPDTLTSMNNLAYTLSAQGDLGGARRLQEGLLSVRSHIAGNVAVGSAHFLDRDFVQIVTKVVQPGEDREKAKSVIARGPMAHRIAQRTGVGEGRSGWSARCGLLLGGSARPESGELSRLGDRRYLSGRLLPR
jgi:eukaryotic-like serine/threonine-protein kinase